MQKKDKDEYAAVKRILNEALVQTSEGKGKERHAIDGQCFEDQLICDINRRLKSFDGNLYQAIKKTYESKRLYHNRGPEFAKKELLGAIIYCVSAIVLIEEGIC